MKKKTSKKSMTLKKKILLIVVSIFLVAIISFFTGYGIYAYQLIKSVPTELTEEVAKQIEGVNTSINLAFENYPELKAHKEIADAIQQNSYLQREITAARELYNDTVQQWNTAVYEWPTKMIVAARNGYTTRIPFSVSAETKARARSNFFGN